MPDCQMSQALSHYAPDFRRRVSALVERFDTISLAEMDAVALLSRVDLKFILTPEQLLGALEPLTASYRILCVEQMLLNRYQTLYFDTPEFSLYQQHHNGSQKRYKIRFRRYVESDLTFLEVKHKDNKGRTKKSRLRVPDITDTFNDGMVRFLSNTVTMDKEKLEAKLWNQFVRITLVSKQNIERLTLDLDLSFGAGMETRRLPGLAIAEVKQEGYSRQSHFVQQMHMVRAHQMSFSKYCIGAAMHYPHLKQNNFKPIFLRMHKLGVNALSGQP